jgi:hypothetical protein
MSSVHSAGLLLSDLTGHSSNTSKIVELSSFGNPKEYFHISSKKMGCIEEMARDGISISDCMDSRAYADSMM